MASPRVRPSKPSSPVRGTWGGARKGAGRKPKGDRAGVSHAARPAFTARHPVHVTLRVGPAVPSLRAERCMSAILGAFAEGKERSGFRFVHFSVQARVIHLLVEAQGARALARGLQSLSIRVARALNRALGRSGRVFADRYDARALGSAREVRDALALVLLDGLRHDDARALPGAAVAPDPFSSGGVFDGWSATPRRDARAAAADDAVAAAVAPARTSLLRTEWRRCGLIDPTEVPPPRRDE